MYFVQPIRLESVYYFVQLIECKCFAEINFYRASKKIGKFTLFDAFKKQLVESEKRNMHFKP